MKYLEFNTDANGKVTKVERDYTFAELAYLIQTKEAEITERRRDEAILGNKDAKEWLKNKRAEIAELRIAMSQLIEG